MANVEKRLKIEGDPYSKLVQMMRKYGHNESSTLAYGTIISPPPAIKLAIDNDPIEYDAVDIIVAERLTAHERIADVLAPVTASQMTATGMGPHTHDITNITLTGARIQYRDELKAGDRVLVECDDENMRYTVLDRLVNYA